MTSGDLFGQYQYGNGAYVGRRQTRRRGETVERLADVGRLVMKAVVNVMT